jgi:nucleotide-binding universal stress UspA family protein
MQDSLAAFQYALANLYRPGDVLHILHVVAETYSSPAPGSVFYAHNSFDPDTDPTLEDAASTFIREEFLSLAEKRGVTANVVLVREHSRREAVGRAVCRKAEELGAEPLVLATHHRSYFEEMMLGSVSKYCARNCKRPIMLVHPSHSQFLS